MRNAEDINMKIALQIGKLNGKRGKIAREQRKLKVIEMWKRVGATKKFKDEEKWNKGNKERKWKKMVRQKCI